VSTKEVIAITNELEVAAEAGESEDAIIQRICLDLGDPRSVDNVIEALERIDMQAEYWNGRAKRSMEVSKALESAASKIRRMVKDILVDADDPQLKGVDYRFSLSRAKPKLLVNEELLPKEFLKEKTTFVPDKTKIQEVLDVGGEVPGCEYVASHALKVYPNKEVA